MDLGYPEPPALIWAKLFDEDQSEPLGEVEYRLHVPGGTITGRTDAESTLRHEVDRTGFYGISVGRFSGSVQARPATWATAPVHVRMRPRPPPRAVLWAKLFDEDGTQVLANVDFRVLVDGMAIPGATDEEGVLRLEGLRPGYLVIRVGPRRGTAPALKTATATAPFAVRMIGPADYPTASSSAPCESREPME